MDITDEVLALIGSARPRGWTDERESWVRSVFDHLTIAILAGDDSAALIAITELHNREPQIAHRLFDTAFSLAEPPVVIVFELRPDVPGATEEER